jgi:hypothetical protein
MHLALGGAVSYLSRRSRGVRLEYRFDRDGERYADPLNLELAWSGNTLPPNPANLLGGNLGDFNSVAFSPGYTEQGPRLRRLPLPTGPLGVGDVYVYLPPGYKEHPETTYPTLYIHDGKDAIVRGQYDRTLYVLGQQGTIPKVVGVFIAAPSDTTDRLAAFTHFADSRYPGVTPQGNAYARYLYDTVMPAVEREFRAAEPRAMLGIDMAGPFTFHLAFNDEDKRFLRIARQSGRFGWGGPNPVYSPYFNELQMAESRLSGVLKRVELDWSDSDHPQVRENDAMHRIFDRANWAGKVHFNKQDDQYAEPWANFRARVSESLAFILGDLVPKK